jgi:hypothetical protein
VNQIPRDLSDEELDEIKKSEAKRAERERLKEKRVNFFGRVIIGLSLLNLGGEVYHKYRMDNVLQNQAEIRQLVDKEATRVASSKQAESNRLNSCQKKTLQNEVYLSQGFRDAEGFPIMQKDIEDNANDAVEIAQRKLSETADENEYTNILREKIKKLEDLIGRLGGKKRPTVEELMEAVEGTKELLSLTSILHNMSAKKSSDRPMKKI